MRKLLDSMIDEHLGFPEEGAAGVKLGLKSSPFGMGGAIKHHPEFKGIYVFTTAVPSPPDGAPQPIEMMFEADAVQWIAVAPEIAVVQQADADGMPRTPGGVIVPSA